MKTGRAILFTSAALLLFGFLPSASAQHSVEGVGREEYDVSSSVVGCRSSSAIADVNRQAVATPSLDTAYEKVLTELDAFCVGGNVQELSHGQPGGGPAGGPVKLSHGQPGGGPAGSPTKLSHGQPGGGPAGEIKERAYKACRVSVGKDGRIVYDHSSARRSVVLHFEPRTDGVKGYYLDAIENTQEVGGEKRRIYAKVRPNNQCSVAAPW
ncbi:MAG TPA: hypothetical protein VM901_00110 [Bdellovibrionota bacterium]|jgi:hypothetical protein|nr:hypothetical protein [Bdellovibrionota bacterium]